MRDLIKYYAGSVRKEWVRLFRDAYHQLEFDTSMIFFKKYLSKKGNILDAGAGPGRYTIGLAKEGYDVTLFDLTPANVDFAKKQVRKAKLEYKVKGFITGSITDLSMFKNDFFDAVLCLGGPLSHLLKDADRVKAVSELVRVTKSTGLIFVSVIGRLGVILSSLVKFPKEIGMHHTKVIEDTGDYLGISRFTATHFFLPEELRSVFEREKVTILEMVGLEGISSNHPKEFDKLAKDKRRFRVWLRTHYNTCTRPEIIGTSEHFMIICRKN